MARVRLRFFEREPTGSTRANLLVQSVLVDEERPGSIVDVQQSDEYLWLVFGR